MISHDRSFLDSIVDHLFVLDGTGEGYDFPATTRSGESLEDERQRYGGVVETVGFRTGQGKAAVGAGAAEADIPRA